MSSKQLATGERVAGVALSADLTFDSGRVSGTAEYVLGADPAGVLLLPAGAGFVLVDATAEGVSVELLKATDFSRPLARVVLDSAPAEAVSASRAARRRPRGNGVGGGGGRAGPLDAFDRHRIRQGA